MMLSGTYVYNLDRKGRVVVPAPFLRVLGARLVLARSPGRVLLAVAPAQWEALARAHQHDPAWVVLCGAGATAQSAFQTSARSHRVLIPAPLREYAGLSSYTDTVVVGLGSGLLIARRDRWEQIVAGAEADLTRRLLGFGEPAVLRGPQDPAAYVRPFLPVEDALEVA